MQYSERTSNFWDRYVESNYVNGDPRANHSFLRLLAQKTGGEYYNLRRMTDEAVFVSLDRPRFGFISVESDEDQIADLNPALSLGDGGRFVLTGRLLAPQAQLRINYGAGGLVMVTSEYVITRAGAAKGALIPLNWAQMRLEALQLLPKQNEWETTCLGKRFGLVTPGTSLIVLEDLEQYLEHEIEPPETLPEMRREYLEFIGRRRKETAQAEAEKIWRVLDMWQRRIEWWETKFDYSPDFKYKQPVGEHDSRPAAAMAVETDAILFDEGPVMFDQLRIEDPAAELAEPEIELLEEEAAMDMMDMDVSVFAKRSRHHRRIRPGGIRATPGYAGPVYYRG